MFGHFQFLLVQHQLIGGNCDICIVLECTNFMLKVASHHSIMRLLALFSMSCLQIMFKINVKLHFVITITLYPHFHAQCHWMPVFLADSVKLYGLTITVKHKYTFESTAALFTTIVCWTWFASWSTGVRNQRSGCWICSLSCQSMCHLRSVAYNR